MEMEKVLEKNRTMHHLMQKATVDALDFQHATEELRSVLQCSVYIMNQSGELLGFSDTETMQIFSRKELEDKQCCKDNQEWIFRSANRCTTSGTMEIVWRFYLL